MMWISFSKQSSAILYDITVKPEDGLDEKLLCLLFITHEHMSFLSLSTERRCNQACCSWTDGPRLQSHGRQLQSVHLLFWQHQGLHRYVGRQHRRMGQRQTGTWTWVKLRTFLHSCQWTSTFVACNQLLHWKTRDAIISWDNTLSYFCQPSMKQNATLLDATSSDYNGSPFSDFGRWHCYIQRFLQKQHRFRRKPL